MKQLYLFVLLFVVNTTMPKSVSLNDDDAQELAEMLRERKEKRQSAEMSARIDAIINAFMYENSPDEATKLYLAAVNGLSAEAKVDFTDKILSGLERFQHKSRVMLPTDRLLPKMREWLVGVAAQVGLTPVLAALEKKRGVVIGFMIKGA